MEDCCLDWQMDSCCDYKWINTATYYGYCNWMNIATIQLPWMPLPCSLLHVVGTLINATT